MKITYNPRSPRPGVITAHLSVYLCFAACEVSSQSYTSREGISSSKTVFISTFTLKCADGRNVSELGSIVRHPNHSVPGDLYLTGFMSHSAEQNPPENLYKVVQFFWACFDEIRLFVVAIQVERWSLELSLEISVYDWWLVRLYVVALSECR